jgi:hypothetical protein
MGVFQMLLLENGQVRTSRLGGVGLASPLPTGPPKLSVRDCRMLQPLKLKIRPI